MSQVHSIIPTINYQTTTIPTRRYPHTIQPTQKSPIMSNHDPIIPTINGQTTIIPARRSPHTIQPTQQSPIIFNHDPIIPKNNDQTTTIPAAPDRQCPPNVPAVTQSQRSNVLSSHSTNQSQHDGADALLSLFHSEDFCVQSPRGNSPSVTL